MKRTLAFLLAWISFTTIHAQVYDLIVTENGDSIASRIDRIEGPAMYFKMKFNNRWIDTSIPLDEVVAYEYDAFARNAIVFRNGTSYIASLKSLQSTPTNMYDVRKNSVYLEYELLTISLIYERVFPVGDRVGLFLAGGVGPGIGFTDVGFYAKGKAGILLGGPRHFFESGIMAITSWDTGPFILAQYRYMAYKGFLFRIGLGFNVQGAEDFYLLPGLSLGYSF